MFCKSTILSVMRSGDQFQASAQMIGSPAHGEARSTLDRNRRGDFSRPAELKSFIRRQAAALQVPGEWKDMRFDAFTKEWGFSKERRVAGSVQQRSLRADSSGVDSNSEARATRTVEERQAVFGDVVEVARAIVPAR
jgi:hypothetical protein